MTTRNRPSIFNQLKIQAACRRLVDIPTIREAMTNAGWPNDGMSDDVILETAHRVRLKLIICTQKEKADSEEFLRKRGLTP